MWFYKSMRVLILANHTAKVSADYFLSNDSTDWGLATCNLAEPKLSYISGSVQINETLGVHIHDSEVWIGYQKAKIPFLFLGCGELNSEAIYNVTSIGFCFNLCGGLFGIKALDDDDIVLSKSNLECKCSNGSLATSPQHCIPSANKMCGEKCYSIYDQLNANDPYVRNLKNATDDCLIYYYPYFQWEPCNRGGFIKVMCSNYSYEDVTSRAIIVDYLARSWAKGNAICIQNNLYPATPRSIMNSNFDLTQIQFYWTGVIRASTLLKKSSIGNLTQYQDAQYAFLETKHLTLQFAATGSKHALCLRASDTKENMRDGVHQSKTLNRDFLAIELGIGIPIGIILATGGVVVIGCLRKRGLLPFGKIQLTEAQSNQKFEERQEQNYEEMIDRNEGNESYCVLDGNVDSEVAAVSYLNPQNDLIGKEIFTNYYNTAS